MKKLLLLAMLVGMTFFSMARPVAAWRPSGWVYHDYPWAYDSGSGDWYWFNTPDAQWVVNLSRGQWSVLPESAMSSGWAYHQDLFAYAQGNGAWHWINEPDIQWVINMRTAQWSRFGRAAHGPLHVIASADAEAAQQVEITAAGGSLTVTVSGGHVITLTIPEGAIPLRERITLTPLVALSGSTLSGGLLGGVDIQPSGLQLYKPATLTISPSDPEMIAELFAPDAQYGLTGFSYSGNGREFHFYPYRIRDGAIHFELSHFSGYGAGKATPQDQQRQYSDHAPGQARDQAQQDVAAILNEEAQRQMADPDYESGENEVALTEILRRWLNESVLPMALAAETDDSILDCAIIEWLTWQANVQLLLGHDEVEVHWPEHYQIRDAIGRGFRNAAEKAHERAVANKDASQIDRFVSLHAGAQLLGWEQDSDLGVDWDSRLQRMARFELDFDSFIRQRLWGDFWIEVSVRIERMPLELEWNELAFFGQGRIFHVSGWTEHMTRFTGDESQAGFEWMSIPFPPYEREHACQGRSLPRKNLPYPQPEELHGVFLSGAPQERFEGEWFTSGGSGYSFDSQHTFWKDALHQLHADRLDELGGIWIDNWDVPMGELYARRRFSRTRDEMTEETVFTLWYAPLP